MAKGFGGRALTVLLWLALLGAVLLVGLRWVDSDVGLVAVVQSMVSLSGFAMAVLVLVAAVTRRWRLTVGGAALLALCAAIAVPTLWGRTVPPARGDLVVMSANLEFGGADPRSLVLAARQHRVDVLVLLEITPAAVDGLRVAGLEALLPESVGRASPSADGTIIRSRAPLTLLDSQRDDASSHAFDQPVASMHLPSGDVVLRAVHSQPPGLDTATAWRSGLADLQAWRLRQPPGTPLLMVGDFNSSWDHPGFRQVAETMTDAHRAAGQGWVRTWPQGRRVIPAFVQLDHVLVRGLGVVDAGVVHLPKTDHAAVWARLAPQA